MNAFGIGSAALHNTSCCSFCRAWPRKFSRFAKPQLCALFFEQGLYYHYKRMQIDRHSFHCFTRMPVLQIASARHHRKQQLALSKRRAFGFNSTHHLIWLKKNKNKKCFKLSWKAKASELMTQTILRLFLIRLSATQFSKVHFKERHSGACQIVQLRLQLTLHYIVPM